MVTDVLAPHMAPVHTNLLASNRCRYMPGKTREYGNQGANKPEKILSRALEVIAIYAIK